MNQIQKFCIVISLQNSPIVLQLNNACELAFYDFFFFIIAFKMWQSLLHNQCLYTCLCLGVSDLVLYFSL